MGYSLEMVEQEIRLLHVYMYGIGEELLNRRGLEIWV